MEQTTGDTIVDSKVFDYVIIGGGAASLALAARMTENPEVKVAVLEAGEKRLAVDHFGHKRKFLNPVDCVGPQYKHSWSHDPALGQVSLNPNVL
jgi:choline dehydrogenase-like flavoprotein